MQSFKMNSREPDFSSPPPYITSHSRSSIMPPPPPPPLLSQSLKKFVPQESMQVNRPGPNRFRKFSDGRRFVRSSPVEFLPPPPPPPVISQESYGRYSSSSLQNQSKSQDRVSQQWYRKNEEVMNVDSIQPQKKQHRDSSLIEYEELSERSENIVEDQRETKPCAADGDVHPNKTTRKRPAEKDLDETDVNAGLPKELTKKFGPLKCELCSVSVNSTVQARMHYAGKLHEKKVKSFLRSWAEETGESLPKLFSGGQQKKQTSEISYCDICDVALTSFAHKMQHNMGRSHRRALARNLLVTGEDEKKEEDLFPSYDPTGRFGIGKQFHPRDNPDVLGLMTEESNTAASNSKNLICELCQVAATCKEQLVMHLKGARHRKAENASKLKSSPDCLPSQASQSGSLLCSVGHDDESTQLASDKDYSIYRTPTGFYYCQPCNLTLNSEAQFIQHCESRKHKNKTATAKEMKQ